jgi:hypothetical protein
VAIGIETVKVVVVAGTTTVNRVKTGFWRTLEVWVIGVRLRALELAGGVAASDGRGVMMEIDDWAEVDCIEFVKLRRLELPVELEAADEDRGVDEVEMRLEVDWPVSVGLKEEELWVLLATAVDEMVTFG